VAKHLFNKGNKFGKGRPKMPSFEIEVKQAEFKNKVYKALIDFQAMTPQQMQAKAQDPTSTAMELSILSVLQQAIKRGDTTRLDSIWNRLIGKPKETVELSGHMDTTSEITLVADWGSSIERKEIDSKD
jgi:hypothetical protein